MKNRFFTITHVFLFFLLAIAVFQNQAQPITVFGGKGETRFINGDFETGNLGPFYTELATDSNIARIINNPKIARHGNYSLECRISRANTIDSTSRIRAEVVYPEFKGANTWAPGYDGRNGSELWYSWSFRIDQLPKGREKGLKINMGNFHGPACHLKYTRRCDTSCDSTGCDTLPTSRCCREKCWLGSPVVGLAIKRDILRDGTWKIWTIQYAGRGAYERYGSFFPNNGSIDTATWYDVVLRIKWSFFTDSAEVDAKIKKASDITYSPLQEDTLEPKFKSWDGKADGIIRGSRTLDSCDFANEPCFFKIGIYCGSPNAPRPDREITAYFDDIKVDTTNPISFHK